MIKVTKAEMDAFNFKISNYELKHLNEVMTKYKINHTYHRVWHFLAQARVESQYGEHRVENNTYLYYAEHYVGINGNRNAADAYKYRGSGYLQLTGRSQYKELSEAYDNPKILSKGAPYVGAFYAWESAGWYWNRNNMNSMADKHEPVRDFSDVINFGSVKPSYDKPNAETDRVNAYNQVRKIIN